MTAQQQIIAKYGMPGAIYQSKYCTLWQIDAAFPWFPAKRILINTDFKERWELALKNIFDANLHHEIITFDGCYVERKVRGRSAISLHSWAMAFDLNAHLERLGQIETHWSAEFLALISAAGISWGGNFQKRKDNMHFSLYNG
jgi:hypothetical protein